MEILESRTLCAYTITQLPFLPTDINNHGAIVGYADSNAYLWNGELVKLGTGQAHGINDAGQIVGYSFTDRIQRATLWYDGDVEFLHPLRESNSKAIAINNVGQVVGQSFDLGETWPTKWTKGIPEIIGNKYASVFDINDTGQSVGVNGLPIHAMGVLWDNGIAIELGTLGWQGSMALAINESTYIVGISHVLHQYNSEWWISAAHPFLWVDNIMTDLGAMPCDNNYIGYGIPKDINESNIIVGLTGCVGLFDVEPETAAIYTDKWEILSFPNWNLQSANAINDRGQIVGVAEHNGQLVGFLLTPFVIDPESARKVIRDMASFS